MNTRTIIFTVASVAAAAAGAAAIPAAPFTDNMVLQRGMRVPVWGTAQPDESVTVSFAGQTKRGTAGTDGRKINGFLCVAEEFDVKHYFDHEYPEHGKYKKQDSSMKLLEPRIEAQKKAFENYQPAEMDKLNDPVLVKQGKYVFMCLSDDNAKAKEIIGA